MLSFIWMQITAPMKKEMSRTMPMESTPKADISFTYFFINILMRSGRENVRPMRSKYLPKVWSDLMMNMGVERVMVRTLLVNCKSTAFSPLVQQKGRKKISSPFLLFTFMIIHFFS